jgi:hypothetical protein
MSTYIILSVFGAVGLLLALAFLLVLRRLAPRSTTLPVTLEWIDDLSTDRYRPMFRLLDEDDLALLIGHPGSGRAREGRIRAERCAIFRDYLRSMSLDFGRICKAIEILLVQSQDDRPDLAVLVLKQKVRFTLAVMEVHSRLVMFRYGWGTVDVSSLLGVFDSLRFELRSMVPVAAVS